MSYRVDTRKNVITWPQNIPLYSSSPSQQGFLLKKSCFIELNGAQLPSVRHTNDYLFTTSKRATYVRFFSKTNWMTMKKETSIFSSKPKFSNGKFITQFLKKTVISSNFSPYSQSTGDSFNLLSGCSNLLILTSFNLHCQTLKILRSWNHQVINLSLMVAVSNVLFRQITSLYKGWSYPFIFGWKLCKKNK